MKCSTHIAALAAVVMGISSGLAFGFEKPYTVKPHDTREMVAFEQQILKTAAEMLPERTVKVELVAPDTKDGRSVYTITIGDNDRKSDGSLGISKAQDESAADGY
jgi:hypothetical protein